MRKSLSFSRRTTPTSDQVIDAAGLAKRFGRVTALDGLDLQVRRHEVHGFLGPNGSGKSTTIRALLGQLRLDGGHAQVLGQDPWRDAVAIHERLAYVPGDVTLWPGLTGGECIDVLGRFQGRANGARRDELVERFALDPSRKTRTYSKGNRQKVALVAALATDVELLLLDEPTAGLDPLMEAEFQTCIRETMGQGRTVLLSSHILGEVEALCDRVSIIRRGRTVRNGTLEELRAETLTTVEATLRHPIPDLAGAPGVESWHEHTLPDGATRATVRVRAEALTPVVSLLIAYQASGLVVAPPTLDELFLGQYHDAPEPAAAGGGEPV
ncbi:MAG TPA: ABC transporter ATP-binding protein [Candidatus Lustribacter sp.]|nr:ABC transporter ATP-binding protein [Candidatus Lustribacter sp.]